MKILKSLFLIIFSTFSLTSFAQQKIQKDTVTVHGMCGMCKKKIEKAAKEAGATTATWNQETKILKIAYNTSATSNQKIQQAVAAIGYDTRDVKAAETAYEGLEECCRYPRGPKPL